MYLINFPYRCYATDLYRLKTIVKDITKTIYIIAFNLRLCATEIWVTELQICLFYERVQDLSFNDSKISCSERLFRTMSDLLVSEGYAAVGYEYINVDDCWLEKERNIHGQLVPDRTRFPRGMKSLSDYVSVDISSIQNNSHRMHY